MLRRLPFAMLLRREKDLYGTREKSPVLDRQYRK